jgi:acyl-CoA thioesterase FadM
MLTRLLYHGLHEYTLPRSQRLNQRFTLRMRAMPWDCDANLHINNGRYLTLMDLGRMQLFIRHGLTRRVMQQRWNMVAASAHILFRRPVNLFTAFELHSRLVGCTQRFMVVEHRMTIAGRDATLAYVPVAFIQHGKMIPLPQALATLKLTQLTELTLPAAAQAALATDHALLETLGKSAEAPPVSVAQHQP